MAKVSFAVVGCGRIGVRHAKHIAANEGADLAYVCDVKEDMAGKLGKEHGCEALFDYRKLLDADVDVVNVCTPNDSHAKISIDLLRAGKNVVCEKPMCLTVEDGLKMIEAEQKSAKKLFVVKQNRYNPPVKAARDVISGGLLGDPYMCVVDCFWNRRDDYYSSSDWKGSLDKDGGALYTQFSHFIDLMLWLYGNVKSVSAYCGNYTHPDIEIEDTGVVILKYESGALGTLNYTTSIFDSNYEGSICLFGSKGSVKIGGQYLNTLEHWRVDGVSKPELEKGNPPNDYGTYRGSMSNHDKVIQNVVDVLGGKGSVETTAGEGLETVKVIQAIYESVKGECEVEL